jgi:hypothetical protein
MADGKFYAVWVDNRNGRDQLWAAPVTVSGPVVKNGSPDLASLDDVSSKLTLVVESTRFDVTSGTARLQVSLVNASSQTISGPVKLRVIDLQSELGIAEIVNADNRMRAQGAVWDLSSLLTNGKLAPSQKSKVRTLIFHLSDVQPFKFTKDKNARTFGLVQMGGRLLGKIL